MISSLEQKFGYFDNLHAKKGEHWCTYHDITTQLDDKFFWGK
jgi:hypothetical protein